MGNHGKDWVKRSFRLKTSELVCADVRGKKAQD